MLSTPKLLLFIFDIQQKQMLEKALGLHAELTWAASFQDLIDKLEHDNYDAVFCARTFLIANWREVVNAVRDVNPNLPVIILSHTANEVEWAEALQAGAFDLLAPPYYERSLFSVVEHAAASYEARLVHNGFQAAAMLR